jgi:phosphate transport system protein
MAIDLRETLAAIKIASELERIGDLAKNIAKRASCSTANRPSGSRRASRAWAARR